MEIYPFFGETHTGEAALSDGFYMYVYRYYKTDDNAYRQGLYITYTDPYWDSSVAWKVLYRKPGKRITFGVRLSFDEAYELAHKVLMEGVLGVDKENDIVFSDYFHPRYIYDDARYEKTEEVF